MLVLLDGNYDYVLKVYFVLLWVCFVIKVDWDCVLVLVVLVIVKVVWDGYMV